MRSYYNPLRKYFKAENEPTNFKILNDFEVPEWDVNTRKCGGCLMYMDMKQEEKTHQTVLEYMRRRGLIQDEIEE